LCHFRTHALQQINLSLDDFVGTGEQRLGYFEPKRLGGLEVDRPNRTVPLNIGIRLGTILACGLQLMFT
jgi:hypothetical protein